jgi:hypothetical protein
VTRRFAPGETFCRFACKTDKEVCSMCVSAWLLLSFFWAFWVFAFGGWWCGGIC